MSGEMPPDSDCESESSDDEGEICGGLESHPSSAAKDLSKEPAAGDRKNEAKSEIARWAVTNRIEQKPLKKLIKLLNNYYDADLPEDPRTLLHTPALKIAVRSCPPGLYWHYGLEKGLRSLVLDDFHGTLHVYFGADGIPLSDSSGSCFGPILCSVDGFDKKILVGAYHGDKKPSDANNFMREFVDEMKIFATRWFDC